jgi:hypothetical protein
MSQGYGSGSQKKSGNMYAMSDTHELTQSSKKETVPGGITTTVTISMNIRPADDISLQGDHIDSASDSPYLHDARHKSSSTTSL